MDFMIAILNRHAWELLSDRCYSYKEARKMRKLIQSRCQPWAGQHSPAIQVIKIGSMRHQRATDPNYPYRYVN